MYGQHKKDYVRVKGAKIYYEVFGHGQPLLFIQGGFGRSASAYHFLADEVAKNRQIILFEIRGTGRSEIKSLKHQEVTLDQILDDIEAIRKALHFEKWDVMGQGTGAGIALHYICKYKKSVGKIILDSPNGINFETYVKLRLNDQPKREDLYPEEIEIYDLIEKYKKEDNIDIERLNKLRNALGLRIYVRQKTSLRAFINWHLNSVVDSYQKADIIIKEFCSKDISKKLTKLENPVLILRGRYDFIPFDVINGLHQQVPNSSVIILENSGHAIWFDERPKVIELVNQFLNIP